MYVSGKFQSEAVLQYKDEQSYDEVGEHELDTENEASYQTKAIECNRHHHPVFPGNGQLILGQEQEKPCGGFDDTDSLSADVTKFEVITMHRKECNGKIGNI